MVHLPTSALTDLYTRFMEEIKTRLEITLHSIEFADEQRNDPLAYLQAEFAVLQIRRVTELIAIAVLLAHNEFEDFRANKLLKQWNPDALFNQLTKLNKDGFPMAFTVNSIAEDRNEADVTVHPKGYLDQEGLCRIYHNCCERLHAGPLKTIIERGKSYNLNEIQGWRNEIMRLLDSHMILLPERKRTMVVRMAIAPDGRVDCVLQDTTLAEELVGPTHTTRRYHSRPPDTGSSAEESPPQQ